MEKSLILLHPIMPFITEEIWQDFRPLHKSELKSISQKKFPKVSKISKDFSEIIILQEAITGIRNIRSEMLIPQKEQINITASKSSLLFKLLKKNKNYLYEMAGVNEILELTKKAPPSAIVLIGKEKIYLPLEGLIDVQDEKNRSQKNLEKLIRSIQSLDNQLKNKKFIKNAPKPLIKERKLQLKEANEKIKKLNDHLKILERI